ncbi:uncharacterized protein [Rhodnius prolixus]|uniref:Uncharacterized protein n=1 Tax=Rhodnius prolixus TaxID=13249 RepID=T1ID38_RHOPR
MMVSKYVVLIFIQLLHIFAEEKCVSNCENLELKENNPCIASADEYPLKRCYENCQVYSEFNNTSSNNIEEEKCLEKCMKLALTEPTSDRKKCRYPPRTCTEDDDEYVKKRCEEYSIFNESTNTNLSNVKAKSLGSKDVIISKSDRYKRETGANDNYSTNPNQPVNSNDLAQSTVCGPNNNQNPQTPFPQNNYYPTQRPGPNQQQYPQTPFPQNNYYPTQRPGPNQQQYPQTPFPQNNYYPTQSPGPNQQQYPQTPFPQNNYYPTERPGPNQQQYPQTPFPQNNYYPTQRPGPNQQQYPQTPFPQNNYYPTQRPGPNQQQYPQTPFPQNNYDPSQGSNCAANNNQYPTSYPTNDNLPNAMNNYPFDPRDALEGNQNRNYPPGAAENAINNQQYPQSNYPIQDPRPSPDNNQYPTSYPTNDNLPFDPRDALEGKFNVYYV